MPHLYFFLILMFMKFPIESVYMPYYLPIEVILILSAQMASFAPSLVAKFSAFMDVATQVYYLLIAVTATPFSIIIISIAELNY